jgi:hypothetical protein
MSDALTKAFYEKSKVILVRPLGSRVALGSVGYFSDGQWVDVSTTKEMFDITLTADAGSGQPNSFSGKSGSRLKFEAKAAGEASAMTPAVANAKARIEISFGSAGAFVMNVKSQRVASATKLGKLMEAIRHAYRYGETMEPHRRWKKNYAVVVGLASAQSVTALLSSSKDATAVISGGATSPATTLGQLDASMSVSFSHESVDDLWMGPAEGYAFRALKIEPSMFSRWDEEPIEYVTASLGFAAAKAPARKRRSAGRPLAPEKVKVVELTPSGRSARVLTVGKLAGTNKRKSTQASHGVRGSVKAKKRSGRK